MARWLKPACGVVLIFVFVIGTVALAVDGDARWLVLAAGAALVLVKGS